MKNLRVNYVIQESNNLSQQPKQQLATKKGAASTVEVNLRTSLLTNHTKLTTKLGSAV